MAAGDPVTKTVTLSLQAQCYHVRVAARLITNNSDYIRVQIRWEVSYILLKMVQMYTNLNIMVTNLYGLVPSWLST